MIWFFLAQLFSTVIQLILVRQKSGQQKELKILILRYQMSIYYYTQKSIPRSPEMDLMSSMLFRHASL